MALTTVTVDLTKPAGTSTMTWQAWRKLADPKTPLNTAAKKVTLKDGKASIRQDPAVVWYVTEPGVTTGRYLSVPTTATTYSALLEVDPVTLKPLDLSTLAAIAAAQSATDARLTALEKLFAALVTTDSKTDAIVFDI